MLQIDRHSLLRTETLDLATKLLVERILSNERKQKEKVITIVRFHSTERKRRESPLKDGCTGDREETVLLPRMGVHKAIPLLGTEASVEDVRRFGRRRSRKWEDRVQRGTGLAVGRCQR